MKQMKRLSQANIWSLSMGFMGIQAGFALQNANASRILQTFGASVDHLSWFWLAAPITGMIVQPIIGHYSDRTWTRLGRRRPFFLAGVILAVLALILLPNAGAFSAILPAIAIGAGLLTLLNLSFNIAMEPFRALVADNLPSEQRTQGFAVQTFLIGVGAVLGSWLPYLLEKYLGVSGIAPTGEVPANVVTSFYIGAALMLVTIVWTIVTTKEYPPAEYAEYHGKAEVHDAKESGFTTILRDIKNMPTTMKQLGLVQFFSWFALFTMWVYTTPAVAEKFYNVPLNDTSSSLYNEAANWVGVIFGIYNAVAMIFSLALPIIAKRTSRKITHAICLVAGGLGLMSFFIFSDPNMLIYSMIGIGIAWASILAMPYVILADSIPSGKMGIYMGIFNFFITIPQIINGIVGGPMVKYLFGSHSVYAILVAGLFMLLAAVSVIFVQDKSEKKSAA
jgi:maltose/moltooligosaccharide transporter